MARQLRVEYKGAICHATARMPGDAPALGTGGDSRYAWVDGLYQKRVAESRQPEDASFRNIRNALDKTTVLAALSKVFKTPEECFRRRRRDSALRGVAARCLCKHAGLTQREAAAVLGMCSGAAVSHQLRKAAGLLQSDPKLRDMVAELDRMLGTGNQLRAVSKTINY